MNYSTRGKINNILYSHLKNLFQEIDFQQYNLIQLSQYEKFGDFQSNIAMILAKKLKKNPLIIASEIISNLTIDFVDSISIEKPGFINFKLKLGFIAKELQSISNCSRLGIPKDSNKQKILVDFSGPNIAKQMHVGHLRSTIIGDAIAKMLEFSGHTVLRVNHLGDWGTQFGMLIEYIKQNSKHNSLSEIEDIEEFYKQAKQLFDSDINFANNSRDNVTLLQNNDKKCLEMWEYICKNSIVNNQKIYDMLNIKISNKGESFYNKYLPQIVKELLDKKIAIQTEGAIGVFSDIIKNKQGQQVPCIIQKSNKAFTYATTDLAAIKYRKEQEKVNQIIYVTDMRQKAHFKQIFDIASRANWVKNPKELKHISFGLMLDSQGNAFKTRQGGTIKLKHLLSKAKDKAISLAKKLNNNIDDIELELIGKNAGWGGVKYSDLIHNRESDYKFDYDKMLNTEGNTAFYLLINYARTHSLANKADLDYNIFLSKQYPFKLIQKEEINLAKNLIKTKDIWEEAIKEVNYHLILTHIYNICKNFSSFWHSCPITTLQDKELKYSRLHLAFIVQKTISWGLQLLGIKPLKKV